MSQGNTTKEHDFNMESESFSDNSLSDKELESIKLFNGVALSSIRSYLSGCKIIHLEKDEVLVESGSVEEFM